MRGEYADFRPWSTLPIRSDTTSPAGRAGRCGALGRFCDSVLLPVGVCAHPRIDPASGEMVMSCSGCSEPYLTWSVIEADGFPVRIQTPVGV